MTSEATESFEALAASLFAASREMFLAEGEHPPYLFLIRDNRPLFAARLEYETSEEKDRVIEHLAGQVYEQGADAVVLIGEQWVWPPEGGDTPDGEVLGMMAAAADGQEISLQADILRDGETVDLGATVPVSGSTPVLDPIRVVWSGN